jgi:alpha-tubulin suppressor-like RCC1 family protein
MVRSFQHLFIYVCFTSVVLLQVSCGGDGGSPPPIDNTSSDTNPTVLNVSSFSATAGNASVSLSWQNPSSEFAGVILRRGLTCPNTPAEGTQVADTLNEGAVDSGLANGTTYCYAAFVYDGIGNFSSGLTLYARPLAPTTASYATVSTGGIHTLAIKADGSLWAWGENYWGQLGDGCLFGDCYDRTRPFQVGSDTTWTSVSGGTVHSAAIKETGTLWSWGDNSSGQIGTGCSGSSRFYFSTPSQVGADTDWISVSAGGFFTAAIKSDGTLWAWGSNYGGQLGDGCVPMSACVYSEVPVQVGIEMDWTKVEAGAVHVVALKSDGTLWAWGINNHGQLGSGTAGAESYSSVPLQIGSDTDWGSIGAGDMYSLAIKTDGTLWAWGDNDAGELGLVCSGSPCSWIYSPTQVGTDINWKEVDGGYNKTLAVKTDGSLWAWGSYSSSTGTALYEPSQIGSGTAWSKISSGGGGGFSGIGGGHFMALESTAPGEFKLSGWGTNMYGQLGIGTMSPVWVPTGVN